MATMAFDGAIKEPIGRPRPATGRAAERLDGVQILRALAAAMVVLLHAQFVVREEAARIRLPYIQITAVPLAAGVDLFFVISGFIIVFASESLWGTGRSGEFLRRRLIRIVPLFWFALTLRLMVLAVGAAAGTKTFPAIGVILSSFLFVPCDGMGFGPDYPFPILDLGWSLDYEMLFYAIAAALVGLRRDRAVAALVAILGGAALAATVAPPANLALRFWTHPLTLEFAGGAVLALLYRRGVRLPGAAAALAAGAGLTWWLLLPLPLVEHSSAPGSYSWLRVATSGVGALLIVAAAVLGRWRPRGRLAGPVVRLGDSSYSLYLVHPFVLLVLTQVIRRLPLSAPLLWPVTLTLVAVAIGVAHLLHRKVERPVIRSLQALTDPRRPPRRVMIDA